METAGYILFFIIFVYLAFGVVFLFVFALAGAVRKPKKYLPVDLKKSIAVIIPSYREDNIILHTASEAAAHNYPADKFKVFVIADKLQPETVQKLRQIPVNVIEVAFETSTKSKSLQACINLLPKDQFEIGMILDADNVMEKGCLEQVNAAFVAGYEAVQCHRTAANKNTAVSILDGVSEEINNNLFRKGPRAFGISANLIGSGMAFTITRLSQIFNLHHILNNPGEDREVDMQLMKANVTVEYIDEALVYDEKVASSAVFQKQRTRWLEAQMTHFKRFFDLEFRHSPANLNYYTKFFQTILLPRSLYILAFGLLMGIFLISYLTDISFVKPSSAWWIGMAVIFLITLLISIPATLYNSSLLRALLHLPLLMWAMVKALFGMKKNRSEFLHTPKTHTYQR